MTGALLALFWAIIVLVGAMGAFVFLLAFGGKA